MITTLVFFLYKFTYVYFYAYTSETYVQVINQDVSRGMYVSR